MKPRVTPGANAAVSSSGVAGGVGTMGGIFGGEPSRGVTAVPSGGGGGGVGGLERGAQQQQQQQRQEQQLEREGAREQEDPEVRQCWNQGKASPTEYFPSYIMRGIRSMRLPSIEFEIVRAHRVGWDRNRPEKDSFDPLEFFGERNIRFLRLHTTRHTLFRFGWIGGKTTHEGRSLHRCAAGGMVSRNAVCASLVGGLVHESADAFSPFRSPSP